MMVEYHQQVLKRQANRENGIQFYGGIFVWGFGIKNGLKVERNAKLYVL